MREISLILIFGMLISACAFMAWDRQHVAQRAYDYGRTVGRIYNQCQFTLERPGGDPRVTTSCRAFIRKHGPGTAESIKL